MNNTLEMASEVRLGYVLGVPPRIVKIISDALMKEMIAAEAVGKEYTSPIIEMDGGMGERGRLIVLAGQVVPGIGLIDSLAEQLGEEPVELESWKIKSKE